MVETVRNIGVDQGWIQDAINDYGQSPHFAGKKPEEVFLEYAVSVIFDIDFDDIRVEDIVDGASDKGIDYITALEDESSGVVDIFIMQVKYKKSFESNVVRLINGGLQWIFEVRREEYQRIANEAMRNKIYEIRQLNQEYGPQNLCVHLFYVTIGDTGVLNESSSREFMQEQTQLSDKWSQFGFRDFEFRTIGASELLSCLGGNKANQREINVDIPILYDQNNPSLIEYHKTGKNYAVICTVKGEDLAEIASTGPINAIFDRNIRSYYGIRGSVNKDIMDTCTGPEAPLFWFLNNGITMIARNAEIIKDPDHPRLRVKGAQIVNGCQTTSTIRDAWRKDSLCPSVHVLLRVYATEDDKLIDRITLTTNNQNRITNRDLRSNDDVQVRIQQRMLEDYGYRYERKNREYRNLVGEAKKKVISNQRAAQAYLAIVLFKPSRARSSPGSIWTDQYNAIFSKATVEDLLACYFITSYCAEQSKRIDKEGIVGQARDAAVYGSYHLARIMGRLVQKDRWGTSYKENVQDLISQLQDNPQKLPDAYASATEILTSIMDNDPEDSSQPTVYFKNTEVQRAINAELSQML